MAITHWVTGPVTISPGENTSHFLDLPAGVTELPHPIFSSITVADPANVARFHFRVFGPVNESQSDAWSGISQVEMIYSLTGEADIDVNLSLVFTDDEAPEPRQYVGR